MKNLVKIFVFAVFALSINSTYAQTRDKEKDEKAIRGNEAVQKELKKIESSEITIGSVVDGEYVLCGTDASSTKYCMTVTVTDDLLGKPLVKITKDLAIIEESSSTQTITGACPTTTVHTVYSTEKKEDGNGDSFPKFAIIVVKTEYSDGRPAAIKYYLGYGWKAGAILSDDGTTIALSMKDKAGNKKDYTTTIKYNGETFDKTNSEATTEIVNNTGDVFSDAQETGTCQTTTVAVAYSDETKQDGNGKSFPKFAVIIVQVEDADGIPIPAQTKYLGYGWKTGATLSEDGTTVKLSLKDDSGSKKNYVSTIKYTTNKGSWSFSKTTN